MDTPEHFIDKDKLDTLFVENKSIKQWIKDNQIAIYITVIFHLLVFLALALNEIRTRTIQSKSIELILQNFEKEPEPKIDPKEEKKKIEEELDKMLREMPNPDVRAPNLATNMAARGNESGRGQGGTSFFSNRNSSSMREEKEKKKKVQEEKKDTGLDDISPDELTQNIEKSQAYKGPSIISYYLENRSAIYLPVPSYKCFKGGDVTVFIEVNAQGYVIDAKIDKRNSRNDECLHKAAIDAAERARFSTSQKTGNQKGNIVYRFMAQ
ncbi:MAG: energy transducer TonB [Prevotellaceae bacterium]|jgi:TonB family protein|nr:energy transducer TonB [Prevotellaceae bacterium]